MADICLCLFDGAYPPNVDWHPPVEMPSVGIRLSSGLVNALAGATCREFDGVPCVILSDADAEKLPVEGLAREHLSRAIQKARADNG